MAPVMGRAVVLVLLLLDVVSSSSTSDYCHFTPRHTLCGDQVSRCVEPPPPPPPPPLSYLQGLGAACGGTALARGVSEAEREEIVELHNQFRALLARGGERRGRPGPQPPAANMKEMVSRIVAL